MKIAITGPFGFVGRHLINRLVADGHNVIAMSHHRILMSHANNQFEVRKGSVNNIESLKAAFAGADVLIHLVGIITESKNSTFEKVVAQGTANVVNAALDCKVKKIIYISALGTDAEAKSRYHQAKYKAEQAVIKSGIDYTILRPSVIYGMGDGFVSLLSKMIKLTPITPVIGDGKYRLQPVYIDDLTSVISGSIDNEMAYGKIIDVAGAEKLEYLQILNIIKKHLGKKRLNFYLPIAVMKPVAFIMEKLLKVPPLTRDQLKMMVAGNTGDINDMKKIFSLEPIKLEDGLKKYL